ncbi:hypothetical protein EVAR_10645_1 [Eumeta japonica]|uniref:Uncharacterized protein n=1 Tax=Eumeta variegata TaxID=151549 RepID=A0A4C1U8D5_EUMVA|nr:hypothetical protein EVAR_10645_1 [Eumeta japonica]
MLKQRRRKRRKQATVFTEMQNRTPEADSSAEIKAWLTLLKTGLAAVSTNKTPRTPVISLGGRSISREMFQVCQLRSYLVADFQGATDSSYVIINSTTFFLHYRAAVAKRVSALPLNEKMSSPNPDEIGYRLCLGIWFGDLLRSPPVAAADVPPFRRNFVITKATIINEVDSDGVTFVTPKRDYTPEHIRAARTTPGAVTRFVC